MSPWPSKDPDDYLPGRSLADAVEPPKVPLPPYRMTQGYALAFGLALVAASVAVTAPSVWWRSVWIYIIGSWVARSHITRWWRFKHGHRSVSWVPASAFAALAVLVGFIVAVAAEPTSGRDRELAIYFGLTVAWFGADTIDWVLRRVDAGRIVRASH